MKKQHYPFQEACFEVHIVGYEGTVLDAVPSPFFLNRVDRSTQGFACIATAETDSLKEAHQYFETAAMWSEKQLKEQFSFGVHVKLEGVKKQKWIDTSDLAHAYEKRVHAFTWDESALVSAWDVHLDGFFDETLKRALHEDGYIILDYLSSRGEQMSTLTLHFLRPDECITEYERVISVVEKCGGFVGNAYYEDALAFAVYGPTIPRPIVLG